MAQPIVCSACGTDVPPGRYSCPSCGEVLASVAGAPRRDAGSTNAVAVQARPIPPVLHEGPAALAVGGDGVVRWPDALPDDSLDGLDGLADAGPASPSPEPEPEPGPPPAMLVAPPDHVPAGEPAWTAVPPPAAAAYASVTPAVSAPPPGSYVPPVAVPAGPAAPARSWAGHGAEAGLAASAASATPSEVEARPSDTAKAAEIVGWLAIAGPALILIGFILPWSSISVIGAEGVGYFDRWGFAGPGHLVVMLGVVAVFVMAILRDRVPLWLGVGLPGIGVGALLIGLVWPYLAGPLGGSIGAVVVAIGALTLVATGVAAVVLDRHAAGDGVV